MKPPAEEIEQACFLLPDLAATEALAAAVGRVLSPGTTVHLSGDLGTGKTAWCRALIRSLGYNGRVKSPTFTLVEPYKLSHLTLYHFDFYRFSSEDELHEAGFDELLDSDAVALVEWPERAQHRLPAPDLRLCLRAVDDAPDARELRVEARGPRGRACLKAMRDAGYSARP